MAALSIKFGTPAPVSFRERGCDTDFQARVTGSAEVFAWDAARCGEGEAAAGALRKTIAELLPGCFARWPEGKLVMGEGSREILGGLLEAALSAAGVTAKLTVRSIDLVGEQADAYRERFGEALTEGVFPTVRTEGLADVPHGALVSFGYHFSSHGMMMGSGSFGGTVLDWDRDGSVTLTDSRSGGGKSARLVYRVRPEIAQKVRDYVAARRLAALAEQKIQTPLVFDSFTSATLSMSFDDSALGGSRCETRSIQCGPAGMTFRVIEDEVHALLEECREAGECVCREEKEAGGAFAGMTGIPEMRPPEQAAGAKPSAPAEPQPGCWVCTKCGFNGNTGRFCAECGSVR